MKELSNTTIYISAYAKLPAEMPSGEIFKYLDIGLIIDYSTEQVEEMSATLVTQETKEFLKQVIVGSSLKGGIEPLLGQVRKRYFGGAQKAVCVALKAIYDKYAALRKEQHWDN